MKWKKIDSGAFWNMAGSGMMAANTVILSMLVGHFSNLTEVGLFTLSLTTAQVLYALALFGSNAMQMTDYQRRYRFTHYFWVKVLSTFLAAAGCAAAVFVLRPGDAAGKYTFLLTGFMLVNSFAELYQSMFFQNRRLDLSGKSLFYRYFLSTMAFAAVYISSRSLTMACIGMLFADIFATAWWILRYAKEFRDSDYRMEPEQTMCLAKEALPLCLSVMGSLLINNCPKYLIDAYLTDEIQGIYSILFMPTYAINLFSQFVFNPFLHRYADALQTDGREFKKLFATHISVIAGCVLLGGGAMWLVGAPLLRIFFGHDLSAYRGMMFLFVLSGGGLALNQLLYYIMVILCKQKVVLGIFCAGMAVTVFSGLALVPRFSIRGAWMSFSAGQLCLLTGYLVVLYRWLNMKVQAHDDRQAEKA